MTINIASWKKTANLIGVILVLLLIPEPASSRKVSRGWNTYADIIIEGVDCAEWSHKNLAKTRAEYLCSYTDSYRFRRFDFNVRKHLHCHAVLWWQIGKNHAEDVSICRRALRVRLDEEGRAWDNRKKVMAAATIAYKRSRPVGERDLVYTMNAIKWPCNTINESDSAKLRDIRIPRNIERKCGEWTSPHKKAESAAFMRSLVWWFAGIAGIIILFFSRETLHTIFSRQPAPWKSKVMTDKARELTRRLDEDRRLAEQEIERNRARRLSELDQKYGPKE